MHLQLTEQLPGEDVYECVHLGNNLQLFTLLKLPVNLYERLHQ